MKNDDGRISLLQTIAEGGRGKALAGRQAAEVTGERGGIEDLPRACLNESGERPHRRTPRRASICGRHKTDETGILASADTPDKAKAERSKWLRPCGDEIQSIRGTIVVREVRRRPISDT
jgi:hypothetical protein